jgi:phosphopantetheinyl transferase (holo-ACP synthase)
VVVCGLQLVSEIESSMANSAHFLSRNFTSSEIEYCRSRPDPSASFAGRWAAKEAVIKAMSSSDMNESTRRLWRSAASPLKEIEVCHWPYIYAPLLCIMCASVVCTVMSWCTTQVSASDSGAPVVTLHGYAKEVATLLGLSDIKVAISHSGEYAIAQAVAR